MHILLQVLLIVFIILYIANLLLNFLHQMHMFQQNGYQYKTHLRWMKKRFFPSVFTPCFLGFLGLLSMLLFGQHAAGAVISIVLLVLADWYSKPKKAKKKLVFTPRVRRMCVTSAILYAALLIPALLTGFFSGTAFFLLQIAMLATYIMVILANLVNTPIERAINRYYVNDAKRIIRELPNLTVIGITGSYGKTSTKFYLGALLGAKYNVLITPESYNTTMGVVKTVRGMLNATHDIFVCEMGAKGVGEIKEICDIVHPKHSMITSIGPQHLESFGSIENIIKTKFEIADCITDGTVFLNTDNDYIRSKTIRKSVIRYGINETHTADYRARDIRVNEKGTSFTLVTKDETYAFETRLIGAHNVQNIVGAIAIAHFMGIALNELYLPVKRLEPVPHRMQVIDGGNRIIIDDAFNSNPNGAKAALETLSLFDGLRVLVTPGMIELGAEEYTLNRAFGAQAARCCDIAVLVGEKQAVPLKEGLLSEHFPADKLYIAKDLNDALAYVERLDSKGKKKIILLENDLTDNYA